MMNAFDAPHPALGREGAQALAGLVTLFVVTMAWWALALWPVEGGGPAWLERTRYVCFGVTETGLPDTGGWIGLIGGPLGMLLILAIGWRDGFRSLRVASRRSWPVAASMASVAVGFALLLTGAGLRVQQAAAATTAPELEGGLPPENYPRLDRPAPPLALTGQEGMVVDLTELRGRPVLVTFAFAHCATICPLIVKDALAAREELAGTGLEPAVLIVTLDPWRDTPSRLPSMAESWRLPAEGAWVLSGEVEEVERVLDAWQVPRDRSPTSGDVIHPALVYVIDRDGRMAFASTGRADALVSLLRRL